MLEVASLSEANLSSQVAPESTALALLASSANHLRVALHRSDNVLISALWELALGVDKARHRGWQAVLQTPPLLTSKDIVVGGAAQNGRAAAARATAPTASAAGSFRSLSAGLAPCDNALHRLLVESAPSLLNLRPLCLSEGVDLGCLAVVLAGSDEVLGVVNTSGLPVGAQKTE